MFEVLRANRLLKLACRLREEKESEAALDALSKALGLLASCGVNRERFWGYKATMMCSSTFAELSLELGRAEDARRVLVEALRLSELSPNSHQVPQMRDLVAWMRETLDGLEVQTP